MLRFCVVSSLFGSVELSVGGPSSSVMRVVSDSC